MLTEKDYCDYDTCVALYELGLTFEDASLSFERNILTNRYEEIPRPSLYEAQKWLREEKKIFVTVGFLMTGDGDWEYEVQNYRGLHKLSTNMYNTYEEALLEGIKEAIKILKDEELTKDF